jgi:EamA domain-containing membrane protein RarD
VVVGWLFLKETMNWQRGLGVALGAISVVLIATSHKAHPPANNDLPTAPASTPAKAPQ